MRELLSSSEVSPLDHSLEKVLPGVHTRLSKQTNAINDLKMSIQTLTVGTNGSSFCDTIIERIGSLNKERDTKLADSLGNIANLLDGNVQVIRSGASQEGVGCDDSLVGLPTDSEPSPSMNGNVDMEAVLKRCKTYHVKQDHRTIHMLYDEWIGTGDFDGKPINGGVREAEILFKHKWRSHWSKADKKYFSRFSQICCGIDRKVGEYGDDLERIERFVDELEDVFKNDALKSISKFVDWMKCKGLVFIQAPCRRSAART